MFSESIATPIRFPSSANLLIDSLDRNNKTITPSTDFSITKQENILAGYFTRFGVVEMVLNYFIPNISALYRTNTLSITIGTQTAVVVIPVGNYSVSGLFQYILTYLNGFDPDDPSVIITQPIFTGVNFYFQGPTPGNLPFFAKSTGPGSAFVNFDIGDTILAQMLRLPRLAGLSSYQVRDPYLVPPQLRYLDFVCTNITYQQGLKDGNTSRYTRDVLYRWYFGWSEIDTLDSRGYPKFQGYLPFVQRRYLNFPKQVKWDTSQPIGQLNFQVFNSDGEIVDVDIDTTTSGPNGSLEWSMGLLVSEQ